jgi:signal transduction histidine kinase
MSELLIVPAHRELNERIHWLIRLRWLAVVGALITIAVANVLLPNILPLVPLVIVTLSMAIYNFFLYMYANRLDQYDFAPRYRQSLVIAHAQIILDLIALTLLLHFAGGLENPFYFYYVLHMITASILLSRKSSRMYAGLATVLFCGMLILEARGVIPHYNLRGYRAPSRYAEPLQVFSVSFALASTLFLTSYFASSVMSRLRAKTKDLVEANQACEYQVQQLADLNAKLKKADQMRTQFTLLVTHELRAPVAAIHSYLKLILDGYVPQDKQREILERSESRAREQLDLIADLLELGRIQQKASTDKTEPVQVDEVLRSVSDMMRTHAEDKGLSFNVEIAPGLPPVKATPDHIKQVWVNLISNAIKYTKPGGVVVASVTQNPNYVMGSVEDTGIGIRPEHKSQIFEEFFRTDEAKAMERQGTGLGLSIVKRIVEIYGGRIWVESEVGKGSKFTFIMPKTN